MAIYKNKKRRNYGSLLRQELFHLQRVFLRPDQFFSQEASISKTTNLAQRALIRQALIRALLLFFPVTLLLLLSILINHEQLYEQNRLIELEVNRSESIWSSPLWELFFPLFWLAVISIMALARHSFLLLFLSREKERERGKNRSLAGSWRLSFYALLPLVLLLAVAASIGNFFTDGVESVAGADLILEQNNMNRTIRLILSLLALAVGLFWEGYILVAGLRRLYGYGLPLALCSWLFPYLIAIFIGGLLALFLLYLLLF